jgi:hypothetical protein
MHKLLIYAIKRLLGAQRRRYFLNGLLRAYAPRAALNKIIAKNFFVLRPLRTPEVDSCRRELRQRYRFTHAKFHPQLLFEFF